MQKLVWSHFLMRVTNLFATRQSPDQGSPSEGLIITIRYLKTCDVSSLRPTCRSTMSTTFEKKGKVPQGCDIMQRLGTWCFGKQYRPRLGKLLFTKAYSRRTRFTGLARGDKGSSSTSWFSAKRAAACIARPATFAHSD